MTSVFIVKMADHDGHHRCLKEKNVPIALILPSRLQDGVESLGMETTSCLCQKHYAAHIWQHSIHVGQWLCGSVGRAVVSDTRGSWFESSHRQKIIEHLFTVNCVLKRQK